MNIRLPQWLSNLVFKLFVSEKTLRELESRAELTGQASTGSRMTLGPLEIETQVSTKRESR